MPVFAIIVGALMDALGVVGYVLSDPRSMTALIPSIFGTILLLCGVLALLVPSARKHAMHAAAAISLIGFIAVMGRSGSKIPALFAGEPVEPSAMAIWFQLTFALLSLIFLIACVRSFIQARFAAKSAQ